FAVAGAGSDDGVVPPYARFTPNGTSSRIAFTGLRAGSVTRLTKRMRPAGPVGSSGPGASTVPQASVAAAIRLAREYRFMVRVLTPWGSRWDMSSAPADPAARRSSRWGWRCGRPRRTAASSADRRAVPPARRRDHG